MTATARPYAQASDLPQLCELLSELDTPCLYAGDLQWRLSKPGLDLNANLRLWKAGDGTLQAFAFIYMPLLALEWEVRPNARGQGLDAEIMIWAMLRMRQAAQICSEPLALRVGAYERDHNRIALLEHYGFAPQNWHSVRLSTPNDLVLPAPVLPQGFVIRPLSGASEIDSYVQAHRQVFPAMNLTVPWRLRLLTMPTYTPELDLVAIAPDNTVAAFALGWPDHKLWENGHQIRGEVEPLGTRPEFRKMGLGRAVLLEAAHRLQARGAQSVVGDVSGSSAAALRVEMAAGGRPAYNVRYYSRVFSP